MRLRRLPLPIVGALVLATLSNIAGGYRAGGVSTGAILTSAEFGIACVLLPTLIRSPVRDLRPYGYFIGWAILVGLLKGFSYDGVQNIVVFAMFGLLVWVAAVYGSPHREAIYGWMRRLGWLVAALFAGSTALEGVGGQSLFSARVFGIQALAFMALTVPQPRSSRSARLLPWVLFLLVAASLSRTALATAALMIIARAAHGRTRKPWRALFAAAGAAAALSWAIFNVGALNERVFAGDTSLKIAGVSVNATGRTAIWHELTRDMGRGPLIGNGPGASSTTLRTGSTGAEEPHNDYLRLLYDYGWIGVAVFVAGYGRLLAGAARRSWRIKGNLTAAAPHTIAALSLLAIAVVMVTDNVLVYSWAMAPAAVLTGLSIGPPRRGGTGSAVRMQPLSGELPSAPR